MSSGAVLFETGDCCAKVLGAADLPTLQQRHPELADLLKDFFAI